MLANRKGAARMADPPSVVIVASGRSVLNARLGDRIDAFSTVVRFQGFEQFTGAEPYVGSKVDICCVNGAWESLHILDKQTIPLLQAAAPLYLWTPTALLPERQALMAEIMTRHGCTWGSLPQERIRALALRIGLTDGSPSSGTMIIDHFLAFEERIAIHGFDFIEPGFDLSAGNYSYYWDRFDRRLGRVSHNMDKERDHVLSLIRKGRVVRLADL